MSARGGVLGPAHRRPDRRGARPARHRAAGRRARLGRRTAPSRRRCAPRSPSCRAATGPRSPRALRPPRRRSWRSRSRRPTPATGGSLPPAGGTRDAWLDEALDAFDATAVDLAFGCGLPSSLPARPLHLHDAAAPPSFAVGDAPAYLVVRTARLRGARRRSTCTCSARGSAPALALVEAVLRAGGLVARRDVHGLATRASRPPSRARRGPRRAWPTRRRGARRSRAAPSASRPPSSGAPTKTARTPACWRPPAARSPSPATAIQC